MLNVEYTVYIVYSIEINYILTDWQGKTSFNHFHCNIGKDAAFHDTHFPCCRAVRTINSF